MKISIVIRTLNEERYLDELLTSIQHQKTGHEVEIVLVDSGSSDRTLEIAATHGALIKKIEKKDFTFGRSLNIGCSASSGDALVFISGHCVPTDELWLDNLAKPLIERKASYIYGRQIGKKTTRFSERQIFQKYFPEIDHIPQEGFFCNNANAIIGTDLWRQFRFNENLTGLEDMYLAKQLVVAGHKIGYAAAACVHHMHDETWRQIEIRYERESIALREILPDEYCSWFELTFRGLHSIFSDLRQLPKVERLSYVQEVIAYRSCQFRGIYLGSHSHLKLTSRIKRRYFYPKEKI